MTICEKYPDKIRDLGGNLYAVCGHLFYFEPDAAGLFDQETPDTLIAFSENLQTEGTILNGLCGHDDVCWVSLNKAGDRTITEGASVEELPPDVREAAREELERNA